MKVYSYCCFFINIIRIILKYLLAIQPSKALKMAGNSIVSKALRKSTNMKAKDLLYLIDSSIKVFRHCKCHIDYSYSL